MRVNWHRTLCSLLLGALTYFIFITISVQPKHDYYENVIPISDPSTTYKTTPNPKTPRILCYINTIPATYFTKAVHVNRTWAKRCTKTIFFSSKHEPTIPVVNLNLTKQESRMHLWSKIRTVLRYIYQYRNDYDYFYKCDDDTYLFYENLVRELSKVHPDDPFMMGYLMIYTSRQLYFSGGAGYVLSREALKRIVEQAIDKHPDCPTYDEDKEDVKMSTCGDAVGVKQYVANDGYGQSKFSWYDPDTFIREYNSYFSFTRKKHKPFPMPQHAISFHYVKPESMYLFDFGTYFLNVFHLPTVS